MLELYGEMIILSADGMYILLNISPVSFLMQRAGSPGGTMPFSFVNEKIQNSPPSSIDLRVYPLYSSLAFERYLLLRLVPVGNHEIMTVVSDA